MRLKKHETDWNETEGRLALPPVAGEPGSICHLNIGSISRCKRQGGLRKALPRELEQKKFSWRARGVESTLPLSKSDIWSRNVEHIRSPIRASRKRLAPECRPRHARSSSLSLKLPRNSFQILTKDSVTVNVDAIMYYKVSNATSAISNVDDYSQSTRLLAATTLRFDKRFGESRLPFFPPSSIPGFFPETCWAPKI